MTKSSIVPDDYRCDHLFLLIGTNPLPNLVAAELLLNERGQVYLVHSSEDAGTAGIAKRLSDLLGKPSHNIRTASMIQVKEADAADIAAKVAAAARRLTGSIGLHYTGGTKAMSVHAYRALQLLDRPVVFSYLDSRTMTLRIEPVGGERRQEFRVALEVKPTIRELTELHGEPLKQGLPSKDVVMSDVATNLAHWCADPDQSVAWRKWCSTRLRAEAHSDGKDWKSEPTLRKVQLDWPDQLALARILKDAFGQVDLPKLSLEAARRAVNVRQCVDLCKWLDGLWLENYVLQCVSAIKDDALLHDYGMTLDTDRAYAEHDFETDVAAVRGFQFFQITCTTSTEKSSCKSKLFEVFERARQLGGDEARVGLVALYKDPAALEQEVQQRWQAEGKVRVFGPGHLLDLAAHLSQWFSTAG
jgi:hypothetical protein